MKKTSKWLLCALAVLLIASTVSIIGFAEENVTEPAQATLSIKSFSLSLENAVYLNFKVQNSDVSTPDNIKILAWNAPPAAYTKGTEDVCLSSRGTEESTGYETFQYTDLSAKDMTKTIYVCAYVNVDGVETYSAPAKFSIAMYAYLKKNATNPDTDLVALLDSMLAYGAQAQTYFEHNTDFLANDTIYQINVVNGTLSDGFSLGWYKENSTITLTAKEAPQENMFFSHWENSAGDRISDEKTAMVTANQTDTYTAVFKKSYSIGLSYAENADGSYRVIGKGDCTDTDIIVPATYNGKPVTTIATDAFYDNTGRNLTSITLPSSVTTIEPRAFVSCYGLKTVTLSEGLQTIGSQAFWESPITTINLPTTLTYVGSNAFMESTRIESVHITDIGSYCSIDFGNEMANPLWNGGGLYLNGERVTSVTVPEGTAKIGSYAFCNYMSLTEIILPDSVNSIGSYAFFNAKGLTRVVIPESVTTINNYAFANNPMVTIYCEAASAPSGWASQWNYGYASGPAAPIVWNFDGANHSYRFVTNGGTAVASIESVYGISLPTPTRSGYRFVGWYENSALTGDPISGKYYNPSGATLYARWMTPSQYAAYCDGSSFSKAITVTEGSNAITLTDLQTRYYRFIPSETRYYDIEGNGDLDTYGILYSASQAMIKSNDDSGPDDNFSIYRSLTAGETYYIAIYKFSSGTESCTLTIT